MGVNIVKRKKKRGKKYVETMNKTEKKKKSIRCVEKNCKMTVLKATASWTLYGTYEITFLV